MIFTLTKGSWRFYINNSITVTDVRTEDVDIMWESVAGYLQDAVDQNQGEFTLEDVRHDLLTGRMVLWIAYDKDARLQACAVCEMRRFTQRTICYIILLGGDGFDNWHWAINAIEEWARENGADAVAALARKGFIKTMRQYGYREPYTVIQKDLTDRRLH